MVGLNIETRLEVNALLDHLLDNDTSDFDREQASRLITLIPCEKKSSWFSISGVMKRNQTVFQAQTAGTGSRSENLPQKDEIKEFDINGRVIWRVGGYKLSHELGEITITFMMDVNPLEQEECYLTYDLPNSPKALLVASPKDYIISLFWLRLGIRMMRRKLWKNPLK